MYIMAGSYNLHYYFCFCGQSNGAADQDTNGNALNNLQMTVAATHNYQTFQQTTVNTLISCHNYVGCHCTIATAAAMSEDNF